MSLSYSEQDMDRAATGREIGKLVAMIFMQCGGDPDAALAMLGELDGLCPPEHDGELDAVPIAQQAIREAREVVGQ